MRGTICLLAAAAFATAAQATDLSVSVRTGNGRGVPNAVVTLYPGAAGDAPRFDWPYRMAQQNLQFDPFVLIVPVGAVVAFPNRDSVRHQVYSFSPAHPFELRLYGKDETRTVRFERAGVVALGCNIHDGMVAFIKVVDTPFAAKSDASGVAALRGAPGGGAILHVWQPYLKSPNNEIVRSIVLPRDGAVRETLLVDLRTPPDRRADY